MNIFVTILLIKVTIIKTISSQDDDGYSDENRPYEFGFNIEGYQHRHEKKDDQGIIMGEFGFITADGVYHLTVYATDENGNFKILKMENIYIGLPMEKLTTPVPAVTNAQPVQQITAKENTKLSGGPACSGCFIPTTTTVRSAISETMKLLPIAKVNQDLLPPSFAYVDTSKDELSPQKNKYKISENEPFDRNQIKQSLNNNPDTQQYEYKKMNVSDLMALLYKFNYTLTYHGHNEVGNRAGEKNGSYFFNGRDGYGRNVKYIANEFGFQPNITLTELNINDTPEEHNEQMLTKLFGNEFIWYY